MMVKQELKKLGLHFVVVDLGEVEVMENLSLEQFDQLKLNLFESGLELMDDKRALLIEKIKLIIVNTVNEYDGME
jgi:hypothetical protein